MAWTFYRMFQSCIAISDPCVPDIDIRKWTCAIEACNACKIYMNDTFIDKLT